MSESGSRTTAEMEADLRRLDPGSQRFKVLSCARDFKASWLKLAEELTRVREQKPMRGWGTARLKPMPVANCVFVKILRTN